MSVKYAEYKREKMRLYEVNPKELIMLLKATIYPLDMCRHFQIRKHFVRIYDPWEEKRQPGANIYLSFLENVSILSLLYIVKLLVKIITDLSEIKFGVQFSSCNNLLTDICNCTVFLKNP